MLYLTQNLWAFERTCDVTLGSLIATWITSAIITSNTSITKWVVKFLCESNKFLCEPDINICIPCLCLWINSYDVVTAEKKTCAFQKVSKQFLRVKTAKLWFFWQNILYSCDNLDQSIRDPESIVECFSIYPSFNSISWTIKV